MIDLNLIKFEYRKKQPVFENLSLKLLPGHIYGLLGSNGAGKSSLLHIICGLLFPQSGKCVVAGDDPANRSPKFLQQVYLLPEEVYTPAISIKSYLSIYAPFYPLFSTEMFYNFLTEFAIPAESKLQDISYGQRKKVMISFALATQAKILLMDEPTNGLDIPSKKQFRKIIAGVLKDNQLIIISTHQVKDLDSLIDHVLVLDDKQIIIDQPVDRITEKLVFKQVLNIDEVPAVIYSEGALKGYAIVGVNNQHEHSKLDMEMFFNAVLSEKEQIRAQFN
ncbi:MAG: ABC transporter ATP-binding protein [Sphingobacteriaceae bacterium]|nr:MAG: ABC transporter ATP-binding protein [Sphingobacteriaceae bacterium]